MPDFTTEPLFDGQWIIRQPRQGYRFSADPLMLCHHVRPGAGQAVLDIGTGCGIIPLVLAKRHPRIRLTGIEIQAPLARLARENVRINGRRSQVAIIHGDIRRQTRTSLAFQPDIITANPPFQKQFSSRINPDIQKAVARHDICLTLPELVEAAARLLSGKGRFWCIYPAGRLKELLSCLMENSLFPVMVRFIHPFSRRPAGRVVVAAGRRRQDGLALPPPLVLHQMDRSWTREALTALQPVLAPGRHRPNRPPSGRNRPPHFERFSA